MARPNEIISNTDKAFAVDANGIPIGFTPLDGGNLYNLNAANLVGNIVDLTLTGNLSVGGTTTLGDVANISISGGTAGQVLVTDGLANLSWSNSSEPLLNRVTSSQHAPQGFDEDVKLTSTTIAFNNATRTFTITPTGSDFSVWIDGVEYVKTAPETIVIPDTTGSHYIYYVAGGTLASNTTFFDIAAVAPVAIVYWNSLTASAQLLLRETHGTGMDNATHEYLHRTRGASMSFVPSTGFVITANTGGTGGVDTDAQIGLSSGTFYDEDIQIDVVNSATPTPNTWEQVLSLPAQIPVLYRSGTGWRLDTPTNFPVKFGTATPQYNTVAGSNWSTTDATNNKFIVQFVVATNNLNYPVVSIMGQAEYNTVNDANAVVFGDLNLTGLPLPELRPLYMLTYDCNTGFANAVKARVAAVEDTRLVTTPTAGLSVVATDIEFRETPQSVFASDPTANTAWSNFVSGAASGNISKLANGTSSVDIPVANDAVLITSGSTQYKFADTELSSNVELTVRIDNTTSGAGQRLSFLAGSTTLTNSTGGNLNIEAGSATATGSRAGNINLFAASGANAALNGAINLWGTGGQKTIHYANGLVTFDGDATAANTTITARRLAVSANGIVNSGSGTTVTTDWTRSIQLFTPTNATTVTVSNPPAAGLTLTMIFLMPSTSYTLAFNGIVNTRCSGGQTSFAPGTQKACHVIIRSVDTTAAGCFVQFDASN